MSNYVNLGCLNPLRQLHKLRDLCKLDKWNRRVDPNQSFLAIIVVESQIIVVKLFKFRLLKSRVGLDGPLDRKLWLCG